MKKHRLAVSIQLFLFLLCGCMPTLIPSDSTTVQRVIEVPGIPKDIIYERSRIWIAKTFRSSKAVIEYENKETGVIIGNGIIHYINKKIDPFGIYAAEIPVRFTMEENIRDGKIKITFDNLFHAHATGDSPVKYRESMDLI